MTHLNSLLTRILGGQETAAVDEIETLIPQDRVLDYLRLELNRANTFLDRRRNQVFFETLAIPDKTTAQRVAIAYDVEYLIGLGLSVDSTIELTRELIGVMQRFGIHYPSTWDRLAQGVLVGSEPELIEETPTLRRKVLD